ncbi:MAG: zf-HC2 domain-containing protein [Corynebacterium sp.]|nr:zf-HC2 domain-containing protein [Corynebacterium sp.]
MSQPRFSDRHRSADTTDSGVQFSSVEHLSHEAVAGYVDRELSPGAMRRATRHLMKCAQCRAEVRAQRGASDTLRRSSAGSPIHIPQELLTKLEGFAREEVPHAGEDNTGGEGALRRIFLRSREK